MLSADVRDSLARCAVVRFFDADLYKSHLQVREAELSDLLGRGFVIVSDDELARYRIAPHLRGAAWNRWWPETGKTPRPPDLVRLANRLAAYYEALGWPVERLRHLVICDRSAASSLFEEIITAADAEFDLARCQDAVDALSDLGRDAFTSDLNDRRIEWQCRIWARSARTAEFLRTGETRYQPRLEAEATLRGLAEGKEKELWLLQVHGRGGTGKTTLLGHFMARTCLVRWPLIACARIDGDAVEPVAALEFPWLLLLEAAEQLNTQLPEGPFVSLLTSMGEHRRILRRMPLGSGVIERSDPELARAAEKVETEFCGALAINARVLIVLDALDHIVSSARPEPGRLRPLFELLERVRGKAGNVQVILAGRDDLSDFSAALPERTVAGLKTISIGNFTENEALDYLTRRGIDDADKRDAIARRSKCIPYIVAGLADEVLQDPDLTARQIREIDKPLVDFMNERILDRIDDPIAQWCLRFSVVPSVLTFEFFTNVMLPLLRDAPSAHTGVPGESDKEAMEKLWQRMARHADLAIWMSSDSSGGQKLIIVNSEVLGSLRKSTSTDPDFRRLHERALAYYQDPDWGKAAVFHVFHSHHPDAIGLWRAAVKHARTTGRFDLARELCEYLFGPDFHDDDGRTDLRIVSRQVQYEAQVQLAYIAAQRAARLPGQKTDGSVLWPDEAAVALAKANRTLDEAATAGERLRVLDEHAVVAAAVELDEAAGEPSLAKVTGSSGDARLIGARRLNREYPASQTSGQLGLVLDAYRLAREAYQDDDTGAAYAAREAAVWLLDIDEPGQALAWAEKARSDELGAEALLALGRPGSALAAVAEPRSARAYYLAARAQLALHHPDKAVSSLLTGQAAFTPAETVSERVGYQLLLAHAHAELLEVETAEYCYVRARSLISDADVENQARIYAAAGLFHLRTTGNLKKAVTELQPDLPSLARGGSAWTTLRLAQAELADRQEQPKLAQQLLDDVITALRSSEIPARRRVRAWLAGLAVRNAPATRLDGLVNDLALVTSSARLAMLEGLRRSRTAGQGQRSTALLKKLVLDAEGGSEKDDNAWQDLIVAEMFRVTGAADEFREHRERALYSIEDPFLRWDLMRADAEFGGHQDHEPDPRAFEISYGDYPMLLAAFITEWADQYDPSGRNWQTGQWLERAAGLLTGRAGEPTRYGPRLREVQAKRAYTQGDNELAANLATEANIGWEELGDSRWIDPTGRPGTGGPAVISLPSQTSEVVIRGSRRSGIVVTGRSRSAFAQGSLQPHSGLVATELGIGTSALTWSHDAGAQLADDLRPWISPVVASGELPVVDVSAEFGDPRSAALPWELIEIDDVPLAVHSRVRFMSRLADGMYQGRREVMYQQCLLKALSIDVGLTDGIPGPLYRAGIEELRRRFGSAAASAPDRETWLAAHEAIRDLARPLSRPLKVMLIQPMVGGSLDSLRRLGERMKELIRCYRAAFAEESWQAGSRLRLHRVEGNEVAALFGSASRQPIDVLHVCTVMEATREMPVLGLDAHTGPPLRAAELNLLVQRLTGVVPPLVILDVQAPPSPVDVRRQLMLRNTFAHQLLSLGYVDTIIATGLEGRRRSGVQWETIAKDLARGANAATIARNIQRLPPTEAAGGDPVAAAEAHAIACTASALFSSVHPDVLAEPGLLGAVLDN
jgi:hypothetical protein